MIYLTDDSIFLNGDEIPVYEKKSFKMEWIKRPEEILGVLFTSKDVQNIAKSADITFIEAIQKCHLKKVASDDGTALYTVV